MNPKTDLYSSFSRLTAHYADGTHERVIEKINDLLRQLSSEGGRVNSDTLRTFFNHHGRLFLLRLGDLFDGPIVGMATLMPVADLDDMIGEVDNVVIDLAYRRRGYSRILMDQVIDYGRKNFMSALELTSRPSRIEANQLYPSIGFRRRETNVWRLSFSGA